ncbi:MAG: ATP-dependent metallopeptidase FtsH/Yme1/Tma family protein, partial [Deltaproteobacteria bacterium]
MKPVSKNIALWLVVSLIIVALYHLFTQPMSNKGAQESIIYSQFIDIVQADKVEEVLIQGENISGKYKGNQNTFKTYAPSRDSSLVALLQSKGIRIAAKPVDDSPWYMTVLISWFPMILLIGVWLFFMRQMQGGG